MANLTITVDTETLKKARIRALEQGASVNAILRDYLAAYAGVQRRQNDAVRDLLNLAHSATSRRGNRRWKRDELYERC
jgi:plasmid stability protein